MLVHLVFAAVNLFNCGFFLF